MKPILVPANTLLNIAYADKPLPQLTSTDSISFLSPTEFSQKFGITYTESLHGDLTEVKFLLNGDVLEKFRAGRPDIPSEAAVLERLKNPLDGLVICNMGAEVGYGLFTSKPIKAGTVLFLYSGELDDPVAYGVPGRDADYTWLPLEEAGVTKTINPSNAGGLARFMQHLPRDFEKHKRNMMKHLQQQFPEALLRARGVNIEEFTNELLSPYAGTDEMGDIIFKSDTIKAQLLSDNVKICTVVVKGFPVVIAVAEDNIEANSQLGFSYGRQYWQSSGKQPRYFFKDGTLIPADAYTLRTKAQPATSLFAVKQKTPEQNYTDGQRAYKAGNYEEALKQFSEALEKFKRLDSARTNVGICIYAIALCHQKKNDFSSAIKHFEACTLIFTQKADQKNFSKSIENYEACLNQTASKPETLYDEAVALYKAKNFHCAIVKLKMAEKLFSAKTGKDLERASCEATLASCYREIGEKAQAITHCQQALEIREKFLPAGDKLIQDTKAKLQGLQTMKCLP